MNKDNTLSIQEVRRDLAGFFDLLAKGKTITVIAHSKPLVTVQSQRSDSEVEKAKNRRQVDRILQAAEEARKSSRGTLDPNKSFKEMYYEDMAKKYGISRR